jgi:phosphosulfolactate synthase (CoM biosynthesis protein A)
MEFKLPPRSEKPREFGTTSVIDFGPDTFGWTGVQGVRDLLDYAADYIDYAKIYAMNALLVPQRTVTTVVNLYREANVKPYSGGILFEYARRTNSFEEMLRHLKKLGISTMEISENYLELSRGQRAEYIGAAQRAGFEVIYEFGRKNPDAPLSLADLEEVVAEVRALDVHHVIIEQCEIDLVAASRPDGLQELARQPWFRHVMVEADPYRFPKQHAQLLQDFGSEVNLANITAGQALRLEGLRRGIGRAVNYTLLAEDV